MSKRTRLVAILAAAVVVVGAVVVVIRSRSDGDVSTAGPAAPTKPNLLVIMTDDQTLESMRVMENTNKLLGAQGTTFTHYYVNTPNCCPSRATYYTGQYAHNTGVQDNVAPLGGFKLLRNTETLPVWLQRAGYYTAHVGKYLNGWGSDGEIQPPPGWSSWFGLIDPTTYRYYDYQVSVNGERRSYGELPEYYQTDVLGAHVVDEIKGRAGSGQPWYISFTPLSPHAEKPETANAEQTEEAPKFKWAMPRAAQRYEKEYPFAKAPRGPAYDEEDVSAKPKEMQQKPRLGPGLQRLIDTGYKTELQTLKATDEWVGKIVQSLSDTGQLDNTVIVFTSDNGYFHGEHRLSFQKYYLYEPAVHLPLYIRGPGFPKGKRIDALATNADLAPTLGTIAGVDAKVETDGLDLATLVKNPPSGFGERAIVLENKTNNGRETHGLQTGRYKYIVHESGEKELYDLKSDPDEVKNLAGTPEVASLEAQLAKRLDALKDCVGEACRTG